MQKVPTLLFWFLVFGLATHGQNIGKAHRTIEIEPPHGIVALFTQPESPVSIVQAQLFTDAQGSFPLIRYEVKNSTSADIISITVDFYNKHSVPSWSKHATGWSETTGRKGSLHAIIGPFATFENIQKRPATPFADSMSLRIDDRKAKGQVLGIWVGFVRQVVFADGREFNSNVNGDDLVELLLGP